MSLPKLLKFLTITVTLISQLFLFLPQIAFAQSFDQNSGCTFTVFQNNSPITSSGIVASQPFSVHYYIPQSMRPGVYQFYAIGGGIKNGDKLVTISDYEGDVSSSQILDTQPPTNSHISFGISLQGSHTPLCSSTTFNYTDKASTEVYTITSSTDQSSITVTAKGVTPNSKSVQVHVYNAAGQSKDLFSSPKVIDSSLWSTSAPWPDDVNYNEAHLAICDSSGHNCKELSGFTTRRTTAGVCPQFVAITPSETPKSTDEVQLQYKPASGKAASDYVVKIDQRVGGTIELTDASASYGVWIADLGTPTSNLMTAHLIRKSDNTVCDTHDIATPDLYNVGPASSKGSCSNCPTAIGNIQSNPNSFVETVLRIAMGIAGGVAFLLIIYGGFRLALSAGDPKAVQEGRDIITSAIVGLLLIIFSVFLLKVIGIDILGLPIK